MKNNYLMKKFNKIYNSNKIITFKNVGYVYIKREWINNFGRFRYY